MPRRAKPLRLVVASTNPGKVGEIEEILAGQGIELVPRPSDVPDVAETGTTFEENARLKARALAAVTGLPALADDSGLEVTALAGRPGVQSARYAGERATDAENVALLLDELRNRADRSARFATVVVLRWPDGAELVAHGTVEGAIAPEGRGTGGFGYDPVFVPDEGDGRTFAELRPAEKHVVSHRGRALRSLADQLI